MGTVVENSRVVPVGVSTVFAYVDDYRHVPTWMYGVKRFDPRGERTQGPGAVFDVSVKLGVAIRSRVEVVSWEQDRLIELTSVKGFKATSRWVFEDLGGRGTRVTGQIEYALPFGPAGTAIGKAIEPLIGHAVTSTTDDLEGQLLALR